MSAQWWDTLGLAANIIGAVMVAVWGLPQPDFSEGENYRTRRTPKPGDTRTEAELEADTKKREKHHMLLSWSGIAVLIIGFVLQLVGTWV